MYWVTPAKTGSSLYMAGYVIGQNGSIDRDEILLEGVPRRLTWVSNDGDYSSDGGKVNHGGYVQIDRLYSGTMFLGRHDKKINFGGAEVIINAGGSPGWSFKGLDRWLFEEEDMGKPIPVWISTEPPPY